MPSIRSLATELRHTAFLTVGTGATAFLSMAYAVYAGNKLGLIQSADFGAALSLVLLVSVAGGPINPTVARFAAQFATQQQWGKIRTLYREIARRVALWGLAAAVVGVAAVSPLSRALHFSTPWPLLTAVGIVYLTLLLNVPRGILRGVQAFGHYNTNVVFEALLRLGIGIGLLQWIHTAVWGLAAYLLALAAVLGLSHWQMQGIWRGQPHDSVDGTAIRRFTAPMFLLALAGSAIENVDMLFVKCFLQPSDAGLYWTAYVLVRAINVLATPFSTVLLPMLTSLHERRQRVLAPLLRMSVCFLLLAAVPLVVFAFWPHVVLGALFKQEFQAAAWLLLPLACARLIAYLAGLITIACISASRFRFVAVYWLTLAAECAGLYAWHDSLVQFVSVVIAAQGMLLVGMLLFVTGAAPRVQEPPAKA